MAKKELGKTTLGMQANVAAFLSYLLGFVTGMIFYVLEKENKFVRFHAMQSTIVFGFLFVLGVVLSYIPFLNKIFVPIISIIDIVLWVFLMIKAYKGEKFKLPFSGEVAEKNS